MRAKGPFAGGAFTATFNVGKEIDTTINGIYTLQVYTFIHCGGPSCGASTDSISIKIKEGNNDFREIFNVGYKVGRKEDKQWILDSADFEITESKIFVKKIRPLIKL